MPVRPKLVNRGPAGLIARLPEGAAEVQRGRGGPELWAKTPKNKIVPELKAFVVDIDSLTPDPQNARLHPERNMESIKDSLCLYGQRTPITVHKKGRKIVVGNGRWQAAKELGWTKIAASIQGMDDLEAVGYGLADNRSAEHAQWDFEVVARLERLMQEAGDGSMVGWSAEEIAGLRAQGLAMAPDQFPEVDENIETEHVCPKCGYAFSGGEVREAGSAEANGDGEEG